MACQLDPRCRLLCRADLAPKAIMHRMEGGSSVTLGPALDKTAHYNHAPSWHSTRLYGGDTSTPFFILRTGNIVGAGGGGGGDLNNLGCFVHTRAGSEVFWLNSGLWKRIGRAARGVILTE